MTDAERIMHMTVRELMRMANRPQESNAGNASLAHLTMLALRDNSIYGDVRQIYDVLYAGFAVDGIIINYQNLADVMARYLQEEKNG